MELLPIPMGPLVIPAAPQSGVELSLILPTYNESGNIATALERIVGVLRGAPSLVFEVIVVDDDSPDLTWKIALGTAKRLPEVRVLRRTAERGLSSAVIRGWQASSGKIIGVMDADLQHPPEVLLDLVALMRDGASLALASRHVEGGGVSDWSLSRRIISRAAQVLGVILLPEVLTRVSDPMSGYFLLRRDGITGRLLEPMGYKILIEVIARGRFDVIREAAYVFCERQVGSSKISRTIYFEYLRHLMHLRMDLLRRSRFLRFALIGFTGALVDMLVLYLLSDPSTLAWGLTRSKIIAAETAIVTNFLGNDAWTFADRVGRSTGLRHKLQRFLKFNLICAVGLVINVVLLNIQFNWFHVNRYAANLLAIVVVTLWNYQLNRLLGWRSTDVNRA